MSRAASPDIGPPIAMLAELTHRCPLRCPYCSNPVELDRRSTELDTATWQRVFTEAANLGVLHLHLSGGEPTARTDLEELIQHAADAGLYSNLITAGVNVSLERLSGFADHGLDHVQLSVQGADSDACDFVSGLGGSFDQKRQFASYVAEVGLPLTLNCVVHRHNIHQIDDLIELARSFGARRLEIAHVQYYGWALENRASLMPGREQVMTAVDVVEKARSRLKGQLVIDAVVPDYYARLPKPCMGGWARQSLNVTPAGKVLPCHAAETIPGLQFDNVQDKSLADIWKKSEAFEAFRGTEWMPEPCRSCDRKEIDWGGCRCQALTFTGDAANTDPACEKSPLHAAMLAIAETDSSEQADIIYRSFNSAATSL